MCLPPNFVAEIIGLGLLNIMRGTHFNACTSIVTFDCLCDLQRSSMGLSSSRKRLFYRHVDDTLLTGLNCPRIEPVSRDHPLLAWSQGKRMAAEFIQLVDGALNPWPLTIIRH